MADFCVICVINDSASLTVLKCDHVFHEHCLEKWINADHKDTNLCPICSVPLERANCGQFYRRTLETASPTCMSQDFILKSYIGLSLAKIKANKPDDEFNNCVTYDEFNNALLHELETHYKPLVKFWDDLQQSIQMILIKEFNATFYIDSFTYHLNN